MHLRIIRDEDPMSPRGWDNLGTMACWHKRHALGDIQPLCPSDEFCEDLPSGTIKLPLYVYDHGGLTISTHSFDCPWDSGPVGYIYAEPNRIKSEYNVTEITDEVIERVTSALRNEVKIYDQYLCGSVWGFIIEKECSECKSLTHDDSCFGFFGDTLEETGILEHIRDSSSLSKQTIEDAWNERK
ncbi:hypothetical protein LCGC14_1903670 [marine sediment metagenome]|uniref:Uncharacterized protein n=1 Tax=marine sediment metagenome TaxID=412755 RepID=A0A0F9I9P6_9ZZZZ